MAEKHEIVEGPTTVVGRLTPNQRSVDLASTLFPFELPTSSMKEVKEFFAEFLRACP